MPRVFGNFLTIRMQALRFPGDTLSVCVSVHMSFDLSINLLDIYLHHLISGSETAFSINLGQLKTVQSLIDQAQTA